MCYKSILGNGYRVIFEKPTLYKDNKSRGRSGHMSHALASLSSTSFMDFNSDCSGKRWSGHSPYGWIEYRLSENSGKSYSAPKVLPYAHECFEDGVYMISVEKAVACEDGTVVAFCLRNDATQLGCCTPWFTPVVVISRDKGESWSAPIEYSPYRGRTYDARYYGGAIYAMHLCNKDFLGTDPEHVYRLYQSTDNGKSFKELSVIPIPYERRGYGAILFDEDGVLHAYAYNEGAECEMDHAISRDGGASWKLLPTCHLDKGIRNPQVAQLDGIYLLHGRAAKEGGFVFYTSLDGATWDEGTFLSETKGLCFYSNNVGLSDEKGNLLLVQYSELYSTENACVDVYHVNLRVEK